MSSEYCLADALTKHSAQQDELIKALETGNLPEVDIILHFVSFSSRRLLQFAGCLSKLLQQKVFTGWWMLQYITNAANAVAMLGVDISSEIYRLFYCQGLWW